MLRGSPRPSGPRGGTGRRAPAYSNEGEARSKLWLTISSSAVDTARHRSPLTLASWRQPSKKQIATSSAYLSRKANEFRVWNARADRSPSSCPRYTTLLVHLSLLRPPPRSVIQKCTHLPALEPLLQESPANILKSSRKPLDFQTSFSFIFIGTFVFCIVCVDFLIG